jgi:hypothetical protein
VAVDAVAGDAAHENVLEPSTEVSPFTGKGGVGKTSMSCAAAVGLVD